MQFLYKREIVMVMSTILKSLNTMKLSSLFILVMVALVVLHAIASLDGTIYSRNYEVSTLEDLRKSLEDWRFLGTFFIVGFVGEWFFAVLQILLVFIVSILIFQIFTQRNFVMSDIGALWRSPVAITWHFLCAIGYALIMHDYEVMSGIDFLHNLITYGMTCALALFVARRESGPQPSSQNDYGMFSICIKSMTVSFLAMIGSRWIFEISIFPFVA